MTRELRPRSSDPTYPDRPWVQLRDPLAEPEFYGLAEPGFGANAQLQAALMAHTCKPNAPGDELFAPPATGQFRMPAYDRCLAAGQGAPAGGRSHMRRDVRLENCQTGVPALNRGSRLDAVGFARVAGGVIPCFLRRVTRLGRQY